MTTRRQVASLALTALFMTACSTEPQKKSAEAERQTPPADAPKSADANKSAETKDTSASTYAVKMVTSKGPVIITVHRDWAPLGAQRFYDLVKAGYYDGARFF